MQGQLNIMRTPMTANHCESAEVQVSSVSLVHLDIYLATCYHPRRGAVLFFGGICLSVCLYVCITTNVESLDIEGSFWSARTSLGNTGQVRIMKVVGSRSRSQQKARNSLFSQCETLSGKKSGYVEDKAVKFARNMGFSDMADRTCDRNLRHVTGSE